MRVTDPATMAKGDGEPSPENEEAAETLKKTL